MALPTMLRAAEREARVWSRLWRSSAFTTMIAPVLLLVAMGVGLGSLVDSDSRELGGLDYLDFIAPGLLVATVVQSVSGSSLYPVIAGQKWMGFHHAMVTSPIRPADVFGGLVLWNTGRSMLGATVFLAAAAALGAVSSPMGLLAIPIAGLTACAFAAPLSAWAATQDGEPMFTVVIRVVITPLYLFSGTLFPVEQLPAGLQFMTKLFPMYHGVELARSATTGTLAVTDVRHVAVLVVYVACGWWWGRRTFLARLAA